MDVLNLMINGAGLLLLFRLVWLVSGHEVRIKILENWRSGFPWLARTKE